MISKRKYIGVYWGFRKESLVQCTENLYGLLKAFGSEHPIFGNWKRTGYAKKKAESNIIGETIDDTRSLLESGVHRRDSDGSTMADMGYSTWIWNELPSGASVRLEVQCGCSADCAIFNTCLVRLPIKGAEAVELAQADVMKRLLGLMVKAWNADFGIVSSDALNAAALPNDSPPRFGWISYLQEASEPTPVLHKDVVIERFGPRGVICDLLGSNSADVTEEIVFKIRNLKQALGNM